jgi:hypothetical protein
MAKTAATIIGVVFVLVGIAGFFRHDLLGAHLGMSHNIVHLVSGVISLYIGSRGSLSAAKSFCIAFGLVYGLLGVVGIAMDEIHVSALDLTLGKIDHYIHIAIGALYLIAGLATKTTAATA